VAVLVEPHASLKYGLPLPPYKYVVADVVVVQ
jgi:hypothetical protein